MERRTPEFIELLIDSYKKHPALYDPRVPNYHNRDVRNAALESVAKELGDHGFTITANEVYAKFKSIRDQYVVKKRNSRLKEASGFPVVGIKWKYGTMLTWLDEFIGHRIQLPMQIGADSMCDYSSNFNEGVDYNPMESSLDPTTIKVDGEEYMGGGVDMQSDDASYHGSGQAASDNSIGSPKQKPVMPGIISSSNENFHSMGQAIGSSASAHMASSDDFSDMLHRTNDFAELAATARYNPSVQQHLVPNPNKNLYRSSMPRRRKRPYATLPRYSNPLPDQTLNSSAGLATLDSSGKDVRREQCDPNAGLSFNQMENTVRSVGRCVTLNSAVEVRQLDEYDRFGGTVADVCRRLPPYLFIRARKEVTTLLCSLEEESLKGADGGKAGTDQENVTDIDEGKT